MNLRRMQRILKTFEVSEYQMHGIKALGATNVLAITEGWCGDAAQIIPVASKVMDHLAIILKLIMVMVIKLCMHISIIYLLKKAKKFIEVKK